MASGSWLSYRQYNGLLIYYTHLVSYRCAIREVRIGIGLNAGPLTVGVIGDGKRSDTGVVGDAVNCAARMEGLT